MTAMTTKATPEPEFVAPAKVGDRVAVNDFGGRYLGTVERAATADRPDTKVRLDDGAEWWVPVAHLEVLAAEAEFVAPFAKGERVVVRSGDRAPYIPKAGTVEREATSDDSRTVVLLDDGTRAWAQPHSLEREPAHVAEAPGEFTVVHYSPITGYWHLEESGAERGKVWTSAEATAKGIAAGYRDMGYKAEAVRLEDVVPGLAPITRSMIDTAR